MTTRPRQQALPADPIDHVLLGAAHLGVGAGPTAGAVDAAPGHLCCESDGTRCHTAAAAASDQWVWKKGR